MALRQLDYETAHRTKMRKALMEPEQLLSLDPNKMLIQARGYHLRPFIADKRAYFLQRRFAGHFFPNPNEEKCAKRVRIATFWGMRWRKTVEMQASPAFERLPQYSDGRPVRYVEGFKPKG